MKEVSHTITAPQTTYTQHDQWLFQHVLTLWLITASDPHKFRSPHTETVPAVKHSMVYTRLKYESVSGNC